MSRAERSGRVLGEFGGFFASARGLSKLAIVVGILLRLVDYANDRPLWIDEKLLAENVVGRPVFEFDKQLVHDQLAPPGFLAVARISSRVLGSSSHALRLFPLACGIAVLFVLERVARRSLPGRAVPIVLALAAVSDDLIYYSTEFKQYMSDLLVALGCILLAWKVGEEELTPRRVALASALGAAATWSSLPSIFLLAAGGLWLAGDAALTRRWRRFCLLTVVGGAWLASFAGCFAVASRLLGESRFMWTWWDFAFLPIPPRSLAQIEQVFWQFVNVFTNPVGIVTLLGPPASALLAFGLFLLGGTSLAMRRNWRVLVVLALPIVLAMAASALRRFPFHGRLLLFLVPSFLLLIAEGTDVVGRRLGRMTLAALMVVLLSGPAVDIFMNIERPRGRTFDSHGDQRNDLLDYFESRERLRSIRRPKPPASSSPLPVSPPPG